MHLSFVSQAPYGAVDSEYFKFPSGTSVFDLWLDCLDTPISSAPPLQSIYWPPSAPRVKAYSHIIGIRFWHEDRKKR